MCYLNDRDGATSSEGKRCEDSGIVWNACYTVFSSVCVALNLETYIPCVILGAHKPVLSETVKRVTNARQSRYVWVTKHITWKTN